jgi:uncharacterized LabA/DUF88 family protein
MDKLKFQLAYAEQRINCDVQPKLLAENPLHYLMDRVRQKFDEIPLEQKLQLAYQGTSTLVILDSDDACKSFLQQCIEDKRYSIFITHDNEPCRVKTLSGIDPLSQLIAMKEQQYIEMKELYLKQTKQNTNVEKTAIVIWDYENIPTKHDFSTKITSDRIKLFVKKMSPTGIYHLFYNSKILAYKRAEELQAQHGMFPHPSYLDKTKANNAGASDREMVRFMFQELWKTKNYHYVIIISGDCDFSPYVRKLKEQNPSREFILIHNANSNREYIDDKMWLDQQGKSHNVVFDSLFADITPDRYIEHEETKKNKTDTKKASLTDSTENKICLHYNIGQCKFGSECKKIHDSKLSPLEEKRLPSGQKICDHYTNGTCKYGVKCKKFHSDVYPKLQEQKICTHYITGFCKHGSDCKKTHDPYLTIAHLPILCTNCNSPHHNIRDCTLPLSHIQMPYGDPIPRCANCKASDHCFDTCNLPCRFFKQGKCDKGYMCRLQHIPFKPEEQQCPNCNDIGHILINCKEPCNYFLQNRCRVRNCPLKHIVLPASQIL